MRETTTKTSFLIGNNNIPPWETPPVLTLSGVQQCASLGGQDSRLSLKLNPFRQPRAMPVYSMNLPQVGNGFMYVFNQQKTDG